MSECVSSDDVLAKTSAMIWEINDDLQRDGLYTFTMFAGMYNSSRQIMVDIQEISEDPFGEQRERLMVSTFFWKQKEQLRDTLYKLYAETV